MIDVNARLAKMAVNSSRGAPMGRSDYVENEEATVVVQRVIFQDGDYDLGGAYWGGGRGTPPLFCAMDEADEVCCFIRAKTREAAVAELLDEYPDLVIEDGRDLHEVTNAYLSAVLFAERDADREDEDDDTSLESENYDVGDFAEDTKIEALGDVVSFIHQAHQAGINTVAWSDEQLGHDIYFSRNGHGAGFWDRGNGRAGDQLHKIADRMGSIYAYVVKADGDDYGVVHIAGG